MLRFGRDNLLIKMPIASELRPVCPQVQTLADYNQCYACSRCSATSPSDESGALSFGIYPRIPLRELPLGHAVPRLSRRMGGSLLLSAAGEIAIRPTSVRRVTLSSRTQALSIVCGVVLKITSIEINEFPVYKSSRGSLTLTPRPRVCARRVALLTRGSRLRIGISAAVLEDALAKIVIEIQFRQILHLLAQATGEIAQHSTAIFPVQDGHWFPP